MYKSCNGGFFYVMVYFLILYFSFIINLFYDVFYYVLFMGCVIDYEYLIGFDLECILKYIMLFK